jgi:hypothetical protein
VLVGKLSVERVGLLGGERCAQRFDGTSVPQRKGVWVVRSRIAWESLKACAIVVADGLAREEAIAAEQRSKVSYLNDCGRSRIQPFGVETGPREYDSKNCASPREG